MALVVAFVLAISQAGNAQNQDAKQLPTNLPLIRTFAAPPAGFDEVGASDEQLANYGFPPRPDRAAFPKAYAGWARAMRASRTRIVPQLKQTNIYHGPAQLRGAAQANESSILYSGNWSGFVDLIGATRYGATSFSAVAAEFVVPTAQQAFGACSTTAVYGSSWVGIDGVSSPDVMQSGIEFDAICYGGDITDSNYYPWVEWYPAAEAGIYNLPIAPGDDFYIEVWDTSATQGYAYLVNENANIAATISLQPPAGTKLVGNSVEWITERPSVGGVTAPLTNYIAEPFWNAYASASSRGLDPGVAEPIIMLDDQDTEISYPTLLGNSSFVVQDAGSAESQ